MQFHEPNDIHYNSQNYDDQTSNILAHFPKKRCHDRFKKKLLQIISLLKKMSKHFLLKEITNICLHKK